MCNLFCIYVKSNLTLYTLLQVHNVKIQKDKDTKDTCEDAKMINIKLLVMQYYYSLNKVLNVTSVDSVF